MASLLVEILCAGDGTKYPKKGETVTLHYIGYRPDGTVFDSTRARGRPFSFKLGEEQVIKGLNDAVEQLSTGERARVTIPSRLAYGSKGFPGLIDKNADLVFDIELLSSEKSEERAVAS